MICGISVAFLAERDYSWHRGLATDFAHIGGGKMLHIPDSVPRW